MSSARPAPGFERSDPPCARTSCFCCSRPSLPASAGPALAQSRRSAGPDRTRASPSAARSRPPSARSTRASSTTPATTTARCATCASCSTRRCARPGTSSCSAQVRTDGISHAQVSALYLRVRPWTTREIDLQIGRVPPTFGLFSTTGYGADNPLVSRPLAYGYLTSLRRDALPRTVDRPDPDARPRLAVAVPGGQHRARAGPAAHRRRALGHRGAGRGWSPGRWSGSGSVTTGSLANPAGAGRQRRAIPAGPRSCSVRIRRVTIGASGARGAYLSRTLDADLPAGRDIDDVPAARRRRRRDAWRPGAGKCAARLIHTWWSLPATRRSAARGRADQRSRGGAKAGCGCCPAWTSRCAASGSPSATSRPTAGRRRGRPTCTRLEAGCRHRGAAPGASSRARGSTTGGRSAAGSARTAWWPVRSWYGSDGCALSPRRWSWPRRRGRDARRPPGAQPGARRRARFAAGSTSAAWRRRRRRARA